MSTVSKGIHLLREDDVNLVDKMRYDAVERLTKPEIRSLLKNHVPGNEYQAKLLENCCMILIYFKIRFRRNSFFSEADGLHNYFLP